MNYVPPVHSPAIHWGNYNEKYAVHNFEKLNRRKHKGMKTTPCGLILYSQLPIMAASPDALVTCKCCGTRPLEVKNPFKHRALSIPKFAEQPDSCLHITPTGEIKLKATHPYYFQVQLQMLVTDADVGYFFLQTASPYNRYYTEEISFDPLLVEEIIAKSTIFFQSVIQPELLEGMLKSSMEKGEERGTACSSGPEALQSATSDEPPPSSAGNVVTPTSSAVECPCVVCTNECVGDPHTMEEMSIYCYSCKEWSQWTCVGLSGQEAFLQKKVTNWFCAKC
uniref:uncharacterized protein LOC117247459 n=1 Tax=Epinephelus lanceolatus TaxID=310571 RepID=UPI0014465E70|nr:uncharacterized protein LOC117247459 [Epinephelus lanceolatus]